MLEQPVGIPRGGVGYKCEIVYDAIVAGHREVASVAVATRLPISTVVRVAALLSDLGQIRIGTPPSFEFELRPITDA